MDDYLAPVEPQGTVQGSRPHAAALLGNVKVEGGDTHIRESNGYADKAPSTMPTPNDVPSSSMADSMSPNPADIDGPPLKKQKQKRNKPTLSCEECVERKTKCDRGRPHCLACIKRQSECKYAHVANVMEETSRSMNTARRMTKPPKKKPIVHQYGGSDSPKSPSDIRPPPRSVSRGSTSSSLGLLSNVPYSHPTASNVFGIGSEHPFANYWTCSGGLPEVISVLPEKVQANILLERYFECVDPIYPMIHRQTFYADYEHFWSLSSEEKADVDATLVALIFSMLAMGTQFVTSNPSKERQQTAEFYVSAGHQALRIASYLNKATNRSIQCMVLITYFLINDNHASDGWAFAGILIRQAYAMGLHRDPNIVCPKSSPFEKQQRRKLWQAVLFQDTFLTVLLSLPPSATHTDVNVDDLVEDTSSIASSDPTDTAYIRGNWHLANLVQETICSPRSLDLPICNTPRQKAQLLSQFRAIHRNLPDVFRLHTTSTSATSLQTLSAMGNKRVVRQTLFITSNYWHNLMLLHSSESAEVPMNVRATLEAAHEAITAFFNLVEIFGPEAGVWWVFNHRAFLEALCIGNVLKSRGEGEENGDRVDGKVDSKDGLIFRAKEDIARMIQIMQMIAQSGEGGCDVARTRVEVLSAYI